MLEESAIFEVRSVVAGLARRGQGKLHWSHESDHRRKIITRVIAEIPVRNLVVVQSCHPDARQERRRCLCMERMLYELDRKISGVVFESRGRKDDARDQELAQSMFDSRKISLRPQMKHERGRDEPLLWISDAVCGAVS